jgi:hypothetical protein
MSLEPLVRRLLDEGRSAEAELVVAEYLRVLLEIARESRPVTQSKCDLAGLYALKLAKALRKPSWIEYTFDLHLHARHVMDHEVIDAFFEAIAVLQTPLPPSFWLYVEALRSMKNGMDRRELESMNRLIRYGTFSPR